MLLERNTDVELSSTATTLINDSTRGNTKVKYSSIQGKWKKYCNNNGYNIQGTTNTYLNFLGEEFDRNLKYATLRGYNAALKGYLTGVDTELLNKALKGIHNVRPPRAKYTAIWDVNLVLAYIGSMITDTDMDITSKVATLLMILSGNRVNMLSHMKLTNMYITNSECTFVFDDVLKHSRPTFNDKPRVLRMYPDDNKLCPVKNIIDYLDILNVVTVRNCSSQPQNHITQQPPTRYNEVDQKQVNISWR